MAVFSTSRLDTALSAERPDPALPMVMVVDDEEGNRQVISTILSPHYRLIEAKDGQEALEILGRLDKPETLACIVSDQRMPRLTGVELFQRVHALLPRTVRIIVTGFIDVETIVDSINKAEIYKFIIKPFDKDDFVLTVRRAIEAFELQRRLDNHHRELERKVQLRTQELNEKNHELATAYQTLAARMADLEKRNTEVTLLGELSKMLQACPTSAEAYRTIASYCPRLFPADAGMLLVRQEGTEPMAPVMQWGGLNTPGVSLQATDCWALRRGTAYRIDTPDAALVCPHIQAMAAPHFPTLCIPLMAQGDTLGLLYMEMPDCADRQDSDAKQRVAVALAEYAALALANIRLREALARR